MLEIWGRKNSGNVQPVMWPSVSSDWNSNATMSVAHSAASTPSNTVSSILTAPSPRYAMAIEFYGNHKPLFDTSPVSMARILCGLRTLTSERWRTSGRNGSRQRHGPILFRYGSASEPQWSNETNKRLQQRLRSLGPHSPSWTCDYHHRPLLPASNSRSGISRWVPGPTSTSISRSSNARPCPTWKSGMPGYVRDLHTRSTS